MQVGNKVYADERGGMTLGFVKTETINGRQETTFEIPSWVYYRPVATMNFLHEPVHALFHAYRINRTHNLHPQSHWYYEEERRAFRHQWTYMKQMYSSEDLAELIALIDNDRFEVIEKRLANLGVMRVHPDTGVFVLDVKHPNYLQNFENPENGPLINAYLDMMSLHLSLIHI